MKWFTIVHFRMEQEVEKSCASGAHAVDLSAVLKAFVNHDNALLRSCITNVLQNHYGGRKMVFKLIKVNSRPVSSLRLEQN